MTLLAASLDPERVGFRPLTEADFSRLAAWLTTPHVARWWDEGELVTLEWVANKYRPRLAADHPTRCFISLYDGREIGFIQQYRIAAYPDYAAALAVDEPAAGVDLYIGEPDLVHRGLGAPLLRRFVREIVFADPTITSCIIGPAVTNRIAIRVYEKAGFRYLKTVGVPDEAEPEYLMRLARDEVGR